MKDLEVEGVVVHFGHAFLGGRRVDEQIESGAAESEGDVDFLKYGDGGK